MIEAEIASNEYLENFVDSLISKKKYSASSSAEYEFLCTPALGPKTLAEIGCPDKREVLPASP